MSLDLRRGVDRFLTTGPGRETAHAFSFGPHYDPANLGFGPMVAHNDDAVGPGSGYPDHPHTDLEIVTWVLEGALTHQDSSGERTVVEPGTVQVMSAGSGIRHSETVDPAAGPTRFLQVWVRPDEPGTEPWHTTAPVADALASGGLVPVVSGSDGDALARIGTRSATLHVAQPPAGADLALPSAPLLHVHVARGSVTLEGGAELRDGDAVRLTDEPARRVVVDGATELLVWSFGDG